MFLKERREQMIGINVNMPKNCQSCPCLKYGEYSAFEKSSCAINHKIVISNNKRPIECPLVELKGDDKQLN